MVQRIREIVRSVYGKYDVWLRALGRFSLAFGSLLVIRNFMGFLPVFGNILVLLILALFASFLPLNGTVLICFVVILGQLYGLSLPALAVGGGILLLVVLLYFGLAPDGALAFLLTPLALALHIPLVVPVAFGLLGTPLAAVGIVAGTVSYYGLQSVLQCSFVPSDASLSTQELFLEEMQTMLSAFLGNGTMILTLIALAAVLIAVFAVRRTEIRYAWQMAVGTGLFIYLLLEIFGVFTLEIPVSVPDLVFGVITASVVGTVLQLFLFDLDYRSTEKLRFQDDEYYYYVTAVPKRKQERSEDEWTQ